MGLIPQQSCFIGSLIKPSQTKVNHHKRAADLRREKVKLKWILFRETGSELFRRKITISRWQKQRWVRGPETATETGKKQQEKERNWRGWSCGMATICRFNSMNLVRTLYWYRPGKITVIISSWLLRLRPRPHGSIWICSGGSGLLLEKLSSICPPARGKHTAATHCISRGGQRQKVLNTLRFPRTVLALWPE